MADKVSWSVVANVAFGWMAGEVSHGAWRWGWGGRKQAAGGFVTMTLAVSGLFVAGVQDQASGQRHVLFIPVINVVPVDQVRTLVHRFSGLDSVALQEQERLVVHAMNINDVCRVSVLNHDCNETITCQTSGCQPSLHPAWFVVTPVWDSARGVAA